MIIFPELMAVFIEDAEAELASAIDRAADRIGRTVARQLARLRDKGRSIKVNKFLPLNEVTELN